MYAPSSKELQGNKNMWEQKYIVKIKLKCSDYDEVIQKLVLLTMINYQTYLTSPLAPSIQVNLEQPKACGRYTESMVTSIYSQPTNIQHNKLISSHVSF
jgi:hypothetical protein